MEKRRPFMLTTILLLLLFTFIQFLYAFKAGWRLSVGIDYLVYTSGFAFYYGIAETIFGGLQIGANIIGVPVSLFFILLAVIFFIISAKKPKLAIPTYVVLGLTFVVTCGSFFSVVGLEVLACLKDLVMNTVASYEGGFVFYGHNAVPVSVLILNAVNGGLMMAAHSLLLYAMFFPLVTFVLSIVLGRGKKKVELEEVK